MQRLGWATGAVAATLLLTACSSGEADSTTAIAALAAENEALREELGDLRQPESTTPDPSASPSVAPSETPSADPTQPGPTSQPTVAPSEPPVPSPTETPTEVAPPDAQRVELQIFVDKVRIVDDCDGLNGKGDYVFKVTVRGEEPGEELLITRGSRDNPLKLSTGDRVPIGQELRSTFAVEPGSARDFLVEFRATEYDLALSGKVPDSRLPKPEFKVHTLDESNYLNTRSYNLTIGNDNCKVALDYFFHLQELS